MWDVNKAIEHLNSHAQQGSVGYCARYVKNAISAGGDISPWPSIEGAKDYGDALLHRGFQVISFESSFISGDVVIIQGIRKADFPEGEITRDHPYGHMAMFNGQQWVSDFKQNNGYYPGGDYRKAKPACVFYRHKDAPGDGSQSASVTGGKLKISYPVRDKDGKEFRSLAEIMRLVDGEAHGTWLLGGNGLWHGAVHISDVSNPFSALTPATLSSGKPVPLQFMADGTIAAYRINNDYLKAHWKGQELRYSSTFVLVKSLCQPDPQKQESWLEFYSLYMHLAPVKDYPVSPCYKVRAGHSGIRLRQYREEEYGLPDGQESGDTRVYQAPPAAGKSLGAGDRVVLSRTGRFYVIKNHEAILTTFGLVRLLKGEAAGNEQYWVTLDPELMEPDGEIQALMPAWMQKVKAKGLFDQVQPGGETEEWEVSAGTPVGFMGCEDYPGSEGGQAEREWFVHLEVLSTDPKMPAFLGNPAGVKGEKRTVLAPKGKVLYTRRTTDGQATFTATPAILDAQRVLPREATTPVTDEAKQWWFNITGSCWLPEKDLAEAGQYDFLKLGFQPLEENSSGDMTKSPYEGWVPEAFGAVSLAAEQGDEWYEQVPPFYRDLIAEMDVNHDGKVTEEEIRQALVVRDPLVRNVVNRLVVRHHSEWYGGRTTGRWEGFYKDLDAEEVAYCEKWQTDLEWMSEVSPFNNGEPVWHFHPVVFLDAIYTKYRGWAHSSFADLLGSVESQNDYTAFNVHVTYRAHFNTNLTSMTIQDVMTSQADLTSNGLFATGRFQIVPVTLKEAVRVLGLDVNVLYNEEIQDKIFEEYLIKIKRPAIINYLEGGGNVEDAIYDWAKEFASAGVRQGKEISRSKTEFETNPDGSVKTDTNGNRIHKRRYATIEGMSYYSGDGINRSHITPDDMVKVLEESKNEGK
ncbi:EF-hand domain-containing protein [Enterobacter hormaechei]|uniref:EF-hand domain-containing protein n=2 Tax=Enterobacter hormaechei TaxID=158836 RepID=UPI001FEDC3C3|nr:EF-hand domain-containing protein [Enterobacter hormaechei]MCE1948304.1 hypothetical protein [Enterobacter hormaechei]MCE1961440.1 hypothetical protein [Enterobacter hormaechei]MCM7815273.1 EF-hand domain-containing protein [Enterobacter hormaechei]